MTKGEHVAPAMFGLGRGAHIERAEAGSRNPPWPQAHQMTCGPTCSMPLLSRCRYAVGSFRTALSLS